MLIACLGHAPQWRHAGVKVSNQGALLLPVYTSGSGVPGGNIR